jgi:hypothetical protein
LKIKGSWNKRNLAGVGAVHWFRRQEGYNWLGYAFGGAPNTNIIGNPNLSIIFGSLRERKWLRVVSAFSLVKWYLDCVTDSGDAAILYCANLNWRGVHLTYSSVLSVYGDSTETHSSMARFRLSSTSSQILVEFPRLDVSGIWKADAAPVQRTVFENASGAVEWKCLQPRSLVTLRVGGQELRGFGYAECLSVTLPPWQLPMRQLRWGRFVSEEESLAWVDWQGEYSMSFAMHNGRDCETLEVSDSEVAIPGATLRMEESFSLRAGRLGSTVLPGAPALGKLLPRSLCDIEEQKWRSRGTLEEPGLISRGWVIHEVVHWKL